MFGHGYADLPLTSLNQIVHRGLCVFAYIVISAYVLVPVLVYFPEVTFENQNASVRFICRLLLRPTPQSLHIPAKTHADLCAP